MGLIVNVKQLVSANLVLYKFLLEPCGTFSIHLVNLEDFQVLLLHKIPYLRDTVLLWLNILYKNAIDSISITILWRVFHIRVSEISLCKSIIMHRELCISLFSRIERFFHLFYSLSPRLFLFRCFVDRHVEQILILPPNLEAPVLLFCYFVWFMRLE